MLSTKDPAPEDKKAKLKLLREFHQKTLNDLGKPNAVFIPKMAYKPHGKTERFIACFLSEINRGEDVFIEFCSRDNDPEDPDRRLYKWIFNAHFEAEYEKTPPDPTTGHVRYLIPVGELIVVKVNKVSEPEITEQKEINFEELADPNDDLPMDQMTMRDYAAIHLGKPVSRKQWLNDLITK